MSARLIGVKGAVDDEQGFVAFLGTGGDCMEQIECLLLAARHGWPGYAAPPLWVVYRLHTSYEVADWVEVDAALGRTQRL